jgi:hypothetical protein
MKELCYTEKDDVWRVVFVFDPDRKAILLVASDKSDVSEKRCHRQLIADADERFDSNLEGPKKQGVK